MSVRLYNKTQRFSSHTANLQPLSILIQTRSVCVCDITRCCSQTDLNKNCTSFNRCSLYFVPSLENQRSQLEALHLVAFVDFKFSTLKGNKPQFLWRWDIRKCLLVVCEHSILHAQLKDKVAPTRCNERQTVTTFHSIIVVWRH